MLTQKVTEIRVEHTRFAIHSVQETLIMSNGVEIARNKQRVCYTPGCDVSEASDAVKALAALWTDQDLEDYRNLAES